MLSFTEAIYMSKMLEFLESKFGFWLITTVLVAAATTANAFLQNYFVERQKKASQTEKISLEIEFRLSQYMAAIRQMTEGKNNDLKLKPSVTAEDVKAVTPNTGRPSCSSQRLRDLLSLSTRIWATTAGVSAR
jgi:hypothetical protein